MIRHMENNGDMRTTKTNTLIPLTQVGRQLHHKSVRLLQETGRSWRRYAARIKKQKNEDQKHPLDGGPPFGIETVTVVRCRNEHGEG